MEKNNRIEDENDLAKVQGGVNLNGTSASELVGSLASERIGISIPFQKDAKNSAGGNNDIFSKFTK